MHAAPCSPFLTLVALFLPLAASAQPLALTRVDRTSVDGARAIATADFDRNGWPDVAHANGTRNSVTILLNTEGVLTRARDIPVGRGPFEIVAADFNRDGIADLAVANADDNSISLLRGRGDGTFTVAVMNAPANPRGLAAADLNRDGRMDLIFTGYLDGSLTVALGATAGFAAPTRFLLTGARPQGIAARDFNHDGAIDLAIAHASAAGVSVLYGNLTASAFTEVVLGGPTTNVLAIADVNRDGWEDIAAASSEGNRVALYLGSQTGPAYSRAFATGASPRDVAAGDLNLDGRVDLVTANRDASTVTVLLGAAQPGLFEPGLSLTAGAGSRALALLDANIDGLPDIVTGNEAAAAVTLFDNAMVLEPAASVFTTTRIGTPSNIFGGGSALYVEDVDRDGRPDVVVAGSDDVSIAVLRASGPSVSLPTGPFLRNFWLTDLNADGHADVLALIDASTTTLRAFLGDGRGAFTERAAGGREASWRGVELADVTGDNRPDVVFGSYSFAAGWSGLVVLPGRGDGTFGTPIESAVDGEFILAGIGDVDRDGKPDAVVRRLPSDQLQIWRGDQAGRFAEGQVLSVPLGDPFFKASVADLNHDGFPDAVVTAGNAAGVLLGSPAGLVWNGYAVRSNFDEWLLPSTIADVNLDGHQDIVFSSTFIAFGNGDGTFRGDRFAFVGSAVAVADVTGDGLPDVLYADTIGTATVLVSQRNSTNRRPTVSAGADFTISFQTQFQEEGFRHAAQASDPDLHGLTYEWRDQSGALISTSPFVQLFSPFRRPGTYRLTVTVSDGRGGSATDAVTVRLTAVKEIVAHAAQGFGQGWDWVADSSAASGVRVYDPNAAAPKVLVALASPERYVTIPFIADPTQVYKLWVRLKADRDDYSNDSVWLQISGAVDATGRRYEPDSTSALTVNLEECAGCGLSGWGWEDDRWGAPNADGRLLRFPSGGYQVIRIQSREDGVSIDQVVLSAEKYLTTRPGAVKNDDTILPYTYWPD